MQIRLRQITLSLRPSVTFEIASTSNNLGIILPKTVLVTKSKLIVEDQSFILFILFKEASLKYRPSTLTRLYINYITESWNRMESFICTGLAQVSLAEARPILQEPGKKSGFIIQKSMHAIFFWETVQECPLLSVNTCWQEGGSCASDAILKNGLLKYLTTVYVLLDQIASWSC